MHPGAKMAKEPNNLIPSQDTGFFQDLILRGKLILRLMGDKRINFFLKLLPVAAVVYLVSPVDLLPGLALPIIGALDDAAVLWLGTTLFVNLCPDAVVQEHMNILQKVVTAQWRDAEEPGGVIDASVQDPESGDEDQGKI
jgi:uncharacterized membrane protein YkvA (DUF1232 family)